MELKVYWLQLAEDKLDHIYSYYSIKAGKRDAGKLINGVVDTTIGIEKQPKIGQVEADLKYKKQEFRYILFNNYKIVYWINYEFGRIEIAKVSTHDKNAERMIEQNNKNFLRNLPSLPAAFYRELCFFALSPRL